MKTTIIREVNDPAGTLRQKAVLYWGDAAGHLWRPGDVDGDEIGEEALPEALKKLYRGLWADHYYAPCHLVETEDGYGIALVVEYNDYHCQTYDVDFDQLFESMISDAKLLEQDSRFEKAHVFLLENTAPSGHEFVIVFNEAMPVPVFEETASSLSNVIYTTLEKQTPVFLRDARRELAEMERRPRRKAGRVRIKSDEPILVANPWEEMIASRIGMCEECMAECIYAVEGVCAYPLLRGVKPDMLNENGCPQCILLLKIR